MQNTPFYVPVCALLQRKKTRFTIMPHSDMFFRKIFNGYKVKNKDIS